MAKMGRKTEIMRC